ncbi:MAG: hypothetical protein GF347_04605 [Candidatus Moranbacteria bacterium]|nr:hypothetical protein [Candidatus Moranbacteria bacterium]
MEKKDFKKSKSKPFLGLGQIFKRVSKRLKDKKGIFIFTFSLFFILILAVFIVYSKKLIPAGEGYVEKREKDYREVKAKVGLFREDVNSNFKGLSLASKSNQEAVNNEGSKEQSKAIAASLQALIIEKNKNIDFSREQNLKLLSEKIENYYLSVEDISRDYESLNNLLIEMTPLLEKLESATNNISFPQTLSSPEDFERSIELINRRLPIFAEIRQNIEELPANTENTREIKTIVADLLNSFEIFTHRQISFLQKRKETAVNKDSKSQNEVLELELQIANEADTAFAEFIEAKEKFDEKLIEEYQKKLENIQVQEVEIENLIQEIKERNSLAKINI